VDKGGKATVVMFPQTLADGDLGATALSGPNGRLDLKGLIPGDYYVIVLPEFSAPEMREVLFLRGLIPRAARVRVEEGSVATVQLSVQTF